MAEGRTERHAEMGRRRREEGNQSLIESKRRKQVGRTMTDEEKGFEGGAEQRWKG